MFLCNSTKDEELDLQSLYWITLLHKCHFKQRYIAGCQMLHEISFQIINSSQYQAKELLWH